ncbi:hypothetical protein BST38_21330 [Mycolicibacterium parafortuitum]|nr:hypothetical protein BST38_21330 [Mycolicibacterium parafortuitum]
MPQFSDSKLKDSLDRLVTLQYMWIDDTNADVIKVDFEALYHGDFLVEGLTSEQLDDDQVLPTAV